MASFFRTWGTSVLIAVWAAGCGQSKPPVERSADTGADPAYLLAEQPEGAVGVAAARRATEEEITVIGRVGGSREPFVEGLAAFTIVDPEVPSCAGEEGCPTPWDYCCQTDRLKDNTAMVKIVGPRGKPVAADARALLGIRGLSVVVVRGDARRDDQGNLTVLGEKLYVKSS